MALYGPSAHKTKTGKRGVEERPAAAGVLIRFTARGRQVLCILFVDFFRIPQLRSSAAREGFGVLWCHIYGSQEVPPWIRMNPPAEFGHVLICCSGPARMGE